MIWIVLANIMDTNPPLCKISWGFPQMSNNSAEIVRLTQMMGWSQSGEHEPYEAFDCGGLVECFTPIVHYHPPVKPPSLFPQCPIDLP